MVSGAVALAVQGRYGAAAGLAVLGALVASNIDNVMRPVVNRRVSNLHPMTTIVGAFAGVGVLGLPGILLGPLAITYLFELAALYRREYGNGHVTVDSAAGSWEAKNRRGPSVHPVRSSIRTASCSPSERRSCEPARPDASATAGHAGAAPRRER